MLNQHKGGISVKKCSSSRGGESSPLEKGDPTYDSISFYSLGGSVFEPILLDPFITHLTCK